MEKADEHDRSDLLHLRKAYFDPLGGRSLLPGVLPILSPDGNGSHQRHRAVLAIRSSRPRGREIRSRAFTGGCGMAGVSAFCLNLPGARARLCRCRRRAHTGFQATLAGLLRRLRLRLPMARAIDDKRVSVSGGVSETVGETFRWRSRNCFTRSVETSPKAPMSITVTITVTSR